MLPCATTPSARESRAKAITVKTDVTKLDSVQALAERAWTLFAREWQEQRCCRENYKIDPDADPRADDPARGERSANAGGVSSANGAQP